MIFDSLRLQAVLSDIAAEWSPGNKETVYDLLWQYYSECNPTSDVRVKQGELALEPFFQELSLDAENALFDVIAELCVAYQRAAFLDGLRLALRLHDELKECSGFRSVQG